MRAACLFGVLVVAKALALSGRNLPFSPWAPFVFFWQDVCAALVFLAADAFLRPALAWLLYGLAVAYIAINAPVSLVLATPLTWTMMRAAGGPLADSISHYVTAMTVGSVVLVAATGLTLPILLRRRHVTPSFAVVAAAMAIVMMGAAADSRIETRGLHRNAFGALIGWRVMRDVDRARVRADADMPASIRRPAGGDLQLLRGAARGRNVVLIVLESTAARYLGLYGAERDPMPVLTELGGRAIVFDAAYAVYPESIKGLFSTLCSRYPAFNTPAEAHAQVPCMSLARTLARAGYRTALFHSGRFEYLGMAPMIAGRGFEVLRDAGGIGGNVRSSFGVDEPSTVQQMLAWIDSLKETDQFFLMYLPVAGHHPYTAPGPGPFDLTGDFGRYLNSLHYGDAALGEFLDGLRSRKLDDRTIFVVHGDHGEAFGQHPDNFGHSLFIYDENVRVPYLIAAPGLVSAPVRAGRVASLIDTTPTILDLLGYPAAVEHQGASLLEPGTRPAFFYTDYSLGWLGLRDWCWKYLYEMDSGRSKLFDVCSDPDEKRDRSPDFGARVQAYRGRVLQWAAAQRESVRDRR